MEGSSGYPHFHLRNLAENCTTTKTQEDSSMGDDRQLLDDRSAQAGYFRTLEAEPELVPQEAEAS